MLVFAVLCTILSPILTSLAGKTQNLYIGGLFEHYDEKLAFTVAINMVNNKYAKSPIRLIGEAVIIKNLNTLEILEKTCDFLEKGVIGVFGPSSHLSSSYIQLVLDRKEIPQIEMHWEENLVRHNCLLNLHPYPAVLTQAYISLINAFHWKEFVAIYENTENLINIEALLHLDHRKMLLRQIEDEGNKDYKKALMAIKKTGIRNFILDCSIGVLGDVLKQAQQVGLMTEHYSYIITNLDLQSLDLRPFQYSGTNISGISLITLEDKHVLGVANQIKTYLGRHNTSVQEEWKLLTQTALIVDAVTLFYQALIELTLTKYEHNVIEAKPLSCDADANWKNGHTIVNYMKRTSVNGLTGIIKFDEEGFRRDFTLNLLELSPTGLKTFGSWRSRTGLNITREIEPTISIVEEGSLMNKSFIIITCLTMPYGMLKETPTQLIGNDRFEGFGIDLIEELSKMLGFNYTIIIQEDGYNGNYNASIKEWNGLIGAIIKGKADLAIADLTITSERESAVDFTLQFMNLGISILYKKPEPVPPSLFMFVSPFSPTVWLLLGLSFLLVSLGFFLMGRLSPSEWTNPYPCVDEPEYLINQFSIRNSLWFTIGSLMQQGTEIAPISISTRTASGVWWFFCLIIVSSYTANLAAFLTVETLVTPFTNVKELSQLTNIKFGAKRGGATAAFFKNAGSNQVKKTIWRHMQEHSDEMTEGNDEGVERVENENYAFFMESTTIEYVTERHCSLASVGAPLDDKGYAIAMKKNSTYRNDLSAAILKLQETGRIEQLKEKWWKEKRGAGKCGAKQDSSATALNLQNVGGVFLVLFVGTVIGFIMSFTEMAAKIYLKTKVSKNSFKRELLKEVKFFIRFKENTKSVS